MRTKFFVIALCALGWVGCGDDANDGDGPAGAGTAGGGAAGSSAAGQSAGAGTSGGAVGMPQAKNSCYAQCDAQEMLADCDPLVPLDVCKSLCDQLVMGTPADCLDEFSAYYDCTVADGFGCTAGFPSPNSDLCQPKQDALDECANGPGGTMCEGANPSGTCPQVACPCPEGTMNVSGFDTDGDGCKCFDEVTCMDLFCD